MSSFQLTSAIRYDPVYSVVNHGQPSPFFLLPYHFDRLRAAAALHGWQDTFTSVSWSSFQSTCHRAVQDYNGPAKGGPLKVRSQAYSFIYSFLTPSALLTAPARTSSRWYYHRHRRPRLTSDRGSYARGSHLPFNGLPSPISRPPDRPLPG
jgi:hypothetical protein